MSLVRSFTSRRNKAVLETTTSRSAKPIDRSQISSPLALISTSNVLLNNAQHIAGTSEIAYRPISPSSPSSSNSGDDSDATLNTVVTATTDASSVDESPADNHLSCYFKPAVDTLGRSSIRQVSNSTTSSTSETPSLPQRQPSHSKQAHESVHRQRSSRRILSPPPSVAGEISHTTDRMSAHSNGHSVEIPRESPFGQELAQLDEVAEEFGHAVRDAEASQDKVIMQTCGLAHFTANDYMSEIQELLSSTFYNQPSTNLSWI